MTLTLSVHGHCSCCPFTRSCGASSAAAAAAAAAAAVAVSSACASCLGENAACHEGGSVHDSMARQRATGGACHLHAARRLRIHVAPRASRRLRKLFGAQRAL